ncbi:Fe(3+)-hydroxamate ABC transporter permease FhuB [Tianweitania populi]|uniref:Fe(3+)-hydroxamate ABC transporter permease FhuB n=1 Tax=Tianweitania populi TaxID=1607949 RepID=UPI001679EC24|nr:Fe(3+)-hydroxamate ABC transporter permease FhuB [Tianweitania populi]
MSDQPAVFARNTSNSIRFLLGICAASPLCLLFYTLQAELPFGFWLQALGGPDVEDVRQLVFFYSLLPRASVAILSGASLGLAGCVLQHVLRNQLAEPTTLGVSAGASTALVVATLWLPFLLDYGAEWVAVAGSTVATALVFALSWRQRLEPVAIILAGLIVSLYCGAFSSVVSFFYYERLSNVFIWSTGTLNQNDWSAVCYLLPRTVGAVILALVFARQLEILGMGDEQARSLGVSTGTARLMLVGLAIFVSAAVVSSVGVLGFVGLAAPSVARMVGVRRIRPRLLASALAGAFLLFLTDQFVQIAGASFHEIPTGVATAVLGSPLLLWLVARRTLRAGVPRQFSEQRLRTMTVGSRAPLGWIAGSLLILLMISLLLGQSGSGWNLAIGTDAQSLLEWRFPRIASAFAAGAMLAVAGVLMQRLTGNVMASPEVLGISSGASLGVIVALFLFDANEGILWRFGPAMAGATLVLTILLSLGRRTEYTPQRMILTGIALGTLLGAASSLAIASGDPRTQTLLGWMAGSTYYVTMEEAKAALLIAGLLIPTTLFLERWLTIAPLGDVVARELGVSLQRSRLIIILLAASLTSASTLLVGPLSFVGLMAPHISRLMGLRKPAQQILGAAVVGAAIFTLADFVGRNVLFPYQVPAGMLATFIGGPYLMWLMSK